MRALHAMFRIQGGFRRNLSGRYTKASGGSPGHITREFAVASRLRFRIDTLNHPVGRPAFLVFATGTYFL